VRVLMPLASPQCPATTRTLAVGVPMLAGEDKRALGGAALDARACDTAAFAAVARATGPVLGGAVWPRMRGVASTVRSAWTAREALARGERCATQRDRWRPADHNTTEAAAAAAAAAALDESFMSASSLGWSSERAARPGSAQPHCPRGDGGHRGPVLVVRAAGDATDARRDGVWERALAELGHPVLLAVGLQQTLETLELDASLAAVVFVPPARPGPTCSREDAAALMQQVVAAIVTGAAAVCDPLIRLVSGGLGGAGRRTARLRGTAGDTGVTELAGWFAHAVTVLDNPQALRDVLNYQ
jgi:hypothetical protein